MRRKKPNPLYAVESMRNRRAEKYFKAKVNTVTTAYAALADHLEQPALQPEKAAFAEALSKQALPKDARILDIGPGIGRHTLALLNKQPAWQPSLVEPNKAMQETLIQTLYPQATVYCTYLHDILDDLPKYDCIQFQHSFHLYAPNTDSYAKLADRLKGHLTPNGILAIQEHFQPTDPADLVEAHRKRAAAAKLPMTDFEAMAPKLSALAEQNNTLIEEGTLLPFDIDSICSGFETHGYTVMQKDTKNHFAFLSPNE